MTEQLNRWREARLLFSWEYIHRRQIFLKAQWNVWDVNSETALTSRKSSFVSLTLWTFSYHCKQRRATLLYHYMVGEVCFTLRPNWALKLNNLGLHIIIFSSVGVSLHNSDSTDYNSDTGLYPAGREIHVWHLSCGAVVRSAVRLVVFLSLQERETWRPQFCTDLSTAQTQAKITSLWSDPTHTRVRTHFSLIVFTHHNTQEITQR